MSAASSASDPVTLVLDRLQEHGVRRSGPGWTARCPAHDDRNPSLSIKAGNDGRVLLNCHTGCDNRDIVDALGLTMSDLFPDTGDRPDRHGANGHAHRFTQPRPRRPPPPAEPRKPAPRQRLGDPVTAYHYTDEHGVELFTKLRYHPEPGKKTFLVRRPDGEWGIGEARRVLYRLPEVINAVADGRAVLIVEGEKDADRACREWGPLVATCNFDGAAKGDQRPKWREEYNETLRGAQVLIVADNDEPGMAHAWAIANSLAGVADRVGVWRPAINTPGADLSDHIDAGHGLTDLIWVEPPATVTTENEQRLPTLSEKFWASRPILGHIRQAAHARGRSADLVLHASLARLSSMLSHKLRFDVGQGFGSLNLFIAAVGPSGVGKSTGADAAAEIMPAPRHLRPDEDGTVLFRDGIPIGSGEGLAESFMGTISRPVLGQFKRNGDAKLERVRTQVRHNAFIYVDEGEALTRMSERAGSTIGPTLRSAWNAGPLGQANAREETTRILPARTYALGVLIGFQRHTCRPLLNDATAGTPQRFLWCSAIDPTVPIEPPEHPGPVFVNLTDATGEPLTGTIVFPESIRAELWQLNHSKVTGELEPDELNSHETLARCKVAALLAVLDGRLKVDEDDWDLAGEMWDQSCRVRESLVEQARRERSRAEWIANAKQIELKVRAAAEAGQVGSKLERIGRKLAAHVAQDGAMTDGAARQKLAGRDRSLYDSAAEWATSAGLLRRVDGGIASPLEVVPND